MFIYVYRETRLHTFSPSHHIRLSFFGPSCMIAHSPRRAPVSVASARPLTVDTVPGGNKCQQRLMVLSGQRDLGVTAARATQDKFRTVI